MKVRHSPFNAGVLTGSTDGAATVESAFSLDTKRLLTPPRSLSSRTIVPARPRLRMVILGPSLTSSLGNGAASTYRGLVRELAARGHEVLFLQRRGEESAGQKMQAVDAVRVEAYSGLKELKNRHAAALRDADFVLVASQITDAAGIGDWVTRHAQGVTAFYDLNTADTLASLGQNGHGSGSAALISRFNLYLSFAGGPLLDQLEDKLGLPMARPLYPAVDARLFFPEYSRQTWDLGFIGRHSNDCLPALERLLLEPARRWNEGRFIVAGSSYPRSLRWPANVKRVAQISAPKRRTFYNSQRFTLDLMPPDPLGMGYSPSVRLFEAAACGTPVITEFWPGLDTFFTPDEEILVSHSADETLIYLEEISELDRRCLGYRARERVLARHTTRHRAAELESYILELLRSATTNSPG